MSLTVTERTAEIERSLVQPLAEGASEAETLCVIPAGLHNARSTEILLSPCKPVLRHSCHTVTYGLITEQLRPGYPNDAASARTHSSATARGFKCSTKLKSPSLYPDYHDIHTSGNRYGLR